VSEIEHVPRPSPHGHCIFCEDIRQEINAKESYVGVFAGPDMHVLGKLPTNVGKFFIKVYYSQRPTDAAAPVRLVVMMPGETAETAATQAEIDFPALMRDFPPPSPELDDPFLSIQMVFGFNPLEIKQEGIIDVRAIRDGKSYRLGALRVKSRPPAEPPTEVAN